MAGTSISIEHETGRAANFIRQLGEHLDDMTVLFHDIGEYLHESHRQRFADQVAPDGTPWAPLSEKYQARKRKNADRILVLDGILRDTLAYNAGPRELEFGTNLIYGATHQFGRDEIPARAYLGISDDDETEILRILHDFVANTPES